MLLETGRLILVENGYAERVNVKLTDVLGAHKLTTGAGYNIWKNQDAFQHDLVLYMAQEHARARIDAVVTAITTLANLDKAGSEDADAGFEAAIRSICVTYFEDFVKKEEFFIALRNYGVKKPSPKLRRAVDTGHKTVHDDLRELISMGLDIQNRQMREDFDIDLFISTVTACVEGLALRHRFDTRTERSRLADAYADAYLALQAYYTEPIPH